MRIWLDGALREADEARVSALDHGLTVGDGVFETLKVVRGRPFALTRHLRRMAHSARGLGLPEPDLAEVERACTAVLADQTAAPLGMVRITYTGGRSPLGSARGDGPPTLVVAASEVTPRPDSTAVVTVPWPRNERGALAGLKTTSYAENVIALARARAAGATEALFGNTVGQLCEGTGSNVYVVLDGIPHTPPLAAGCLPGVTRALVNEWCDVRETDLPLSSLDRAAEIFLTSSLRNVQAVHTITTAAGTRHLTGTPGPVTAEVTRVFARRAAAEHDPR